MGAGLVLAVLLLHAMLLDGLVPRPPPGAGRGREALPVRPVQVRTLAARPLAPAPDLGLAAPAAGRLVAAPEPAPVAAAPVAAVAATPAAAAAATPLPAAQAPVAGVAAPAAAAPSRAVPDTASPDIRTPDIRASDLRAADMAPSDRAASSSTEPPPVYPTRLPAPVQLRYALQLNGQAGEAVLDWRHDGQRYVLALEARSGRVQPLLEQVSQGGFDAAGLAPERFTDRRRGRGQRAANFRRDIGRIGFSGPQIDYPAWPGAQDRLSWWAQLAAIQAAAVSPLPAITLFVVDARGAGDWWRFVPQGEAVLETAVGRVVAQHWRRDPDAADRHDSQRTEVWLDATRGHWPVLLRTTSLRNGDVVELRLASEPGLPR